MDRFQSAQKRSPGEQNADLAVAVAISGGGQRAANFGAGVLLGLEEYELESSVNRNLLKEVDYFSTVSGGGMVVGAYISSLHNHATMGESGSPAYSFSEALKVWGNASENCEDSNVENFYEEVRTNHPEQICDPCLRRHLERGYRKNIMGALWEPSVIFTNLDRGDLLERTFSREIMGRNWTKQELTLGDIFIPIDSDTIPVLPYWVANATVFENGAIFPFTPDVLEAYGVRGYTHDMKVVRFADGDSQSQEQFIAAVPLSLGMTASGSFPSLIASRTLHASLGYESQENEYLHLLDGGLSDNLGVFSALDLLHQDTVASRKVIVVVDAFPGEFAPYSKNEGSPRFLTTYRQLTSIALNTWRGRHMQMLNELTDQSVTKIYISFDDLFRPQEADPYREDSKKVIQLYDDLSAFGFAPPDDAKERKAFEEKKEGRSPWALARSIGTNYNVDKWEQDFLIAVGRYLVHQKRSEFRILADTP